MVVQCTTATTSSMSDAESAAILRFVLQDLKSQQQQQQQPLGSTRLNVSDMHGQVLSALPAADLTLLQSASQLVHRGAVKRVTAQPSGRSFFRVESLNRYQPRNSNGDNDDAADASHVSHLDTSASQPFDGSLVRGRGPNYYNVLPHYCSCQGFHEHTVVQSPVAMVRYVYISIEWAYAHITHVAVCVCV